jgi:hypothetical protein
MKTDARIDSIVASLLYLVTAYYRRPCPALAACIAWHVACLAGHPGAARVLSDVALALRLAPRCLRAQEHPLCALRRSIYLPPFTSSYTSRRTRFERCGLIARKQSQRFEERT